MAKPEDKQSFAVAGADSSFRGRSNDVFDSLNVIAAKHSAFEKTLNKTESVDPDFDSKDDPEEEEKGEEKEGLGEERADFKVPSGSAPKGKIVPQHQSKPDDWTRYNLSDVKCSGSDAGNEAMAIEFIENLQKAQRKNPDEDEAMDLEYSRHTFRKPDLKRASGDPGGSVRNAKKASSGLDHLVEKDEEEEEEEEESAQEEVAAVAFKRKIRKIGNLRSKDESSEEEEDEKDEEKEEKKKESSEEEEEEDEEDLNDGLT